MFSFLSSHFLNSAFGFLHVPILSKLGISEILYAEKVSWILKAWWGVQVLRAGAAAPAASFLVGAVLPAVLWVEFSFLRLSGELLLQGRKDERTRESFLRRLFGQFVSSEQASRT